MKSWAEIGFEIEITGDDSPSLRLLQPVDPNKTHGESMHHSGGACTETLLIYGKPIKEVLEKIQNPHFLIVGLGIGYIEMVIAREALLLGKTASQVGLITSYESIPELREFFFKWLHGNTAELNSEVVKVYNLVVSAVLKDTDLTIANVQEFLKQIFVSEDKIEKSLEADSHPLSRYHCILWDAFSSKTTPHLWEEEFLNRFLEQGSAEQAVLSTYACKSSLKRALAKAGYKIISREGFKWKRNSTLAVKNLLYSS